MRGAAGFAPATVLLILGLVHLQLPRPANSAAARKLPEVINLSRFASAIANGTCGPSGYEFYCKLPNRDASALSAAAKQPQSCPVCIRRGALDTSVTGNLTLLRLLAAARDSHHDASNLIDGSASTWWQSSTLAAGWEHQRITIDLDLGQIFEILYVSLQAGPSPRPGNWILESSRDGVTYRPWRYFAITDSECWTAYRRFAVLERSMARGSAEAFCTSEYSRLDPLENGEVQVFLNTSSNGELTLARYVRIQLLKMNMYNSDRTYYTINGKLDEATARTYYYSIRELAIGGRCICNGYASRCLWNIEQRRLKCACEGNTCGDNCEKCCPLFNQKVWIPASSPSPVSRLMQQSCEECNCHGHAQRCIYNSTVDELMLSLNKDGKYLGGGVCLDCQKYTAGINCEHCKQGYYRPRGMVPSDAHPCWPCRCHPNGSSLPCVSNDRHTNKEPGSCICKPGYSGELCGTCASGYIGFPNCTICPCTALLSQGNGSRSCITRDHWRELISDLGAALACGCLPKLDSSGTPMFCDDHGFICDESSDGCKSCIDGSTGPKCDQMDPNVTKCLPGFYSSSTAEIGSIQCLPCACPTVDMTRHSQLSCQPIADGYKCLNCTAGHAGQHCQRCQPNFYSEVIDGVARHCKPCNCSATEDDSLEVACHPVTGACLQCDKGSTGEYCEKCMPGFYGPASNGSCLPCACNQQGAKDPLCNQVTGQCQCKQNYIGQHCSKCIDGMTKVAGKCTPCACHADGSTSSTCNWETSQCSCKQGVGGMSCNKCIAGYFNLSLDGCMRCLPCSKPWEVCNSINGTCGCPSAMHGPRCEHCNAGSWRPQQNVLCEECACDIHGSLHWSCEVTSGQCDCKKGFGGRACDHCAFGYYGYPHCMPCDCHLPGTEAWACNGSGDGLCACSQQLGACPCKANVEGSRCNRCKDGTFGMHPAKTDGCTECFCHGRSRKCDQMPGGLTSVLSWKVAGRNEASLGTLPWDNHRFTHPIVLPREMLDKMALCYGGSLTLHVYAEGNGAAGRQESAGFKDGQPLASFIGASVFTFAYYMSMPNNLTGFQRNPHSITVPLLESLWIGPAIGRASGKRRAFIVALSKLDSFHLTVPLPLLLWSISLECPQGVASGSSAAGGQGSSRTGQQEPDRAAAAASASELGLAHAELCQCPAGYMGAACETIAAGYFALVPKIAAEHDSSVATSSEHGINGQHIDLDAFLGVSVPCMCNNHSQSCDPTNGVCKNCRDWTEGPNCENCQIGYYGNATAGTAFDCLPCACPLFSPRNNFSPTCYGSRDDYTCNACPRGYHGNHCQFCHSGYYGDPQKEGSSCQACRCDKTGSVHGICDMHTGQCVCQPGYSGRHCESCKSSQIAPAGGSCLTCNNSCIMELVLNLVEISRLVDSMHSNLPLQLSLPIFKRKAAEALVLLNSLMVQVESTRGLLAPNEASVALLLNQAQTEAESVLSRISSLSGTVLVKKLDTLSASVSKAALAVKDVLAYLHNKRSSLVNMITGITSESLASSEIALEILNAFNMLQSSDMFINSTWESAKEELRAAVEDRKTVLMMPRLTHSSNLTSALLDAQKRIRDLELVIHNVSTQQTHVEIGIRQRQLALLKERGNGTHLDDHQINSTIHYAAECNWDSLQLLKETAASLQASTESFQTKLNDSLELLKYRFSLQPNKTQQALDYIRQARIRVELQKQIDGAQNRTMKDILENSHQALRALRVYDDITSTVNASHSTADHTSIVLLRVNSEISSFNSTLSTTLMAIANSSDHVSAVLRANQDVNTKLDALKNSYLALTTQCDQEVSRRNETRGYLNQIRELQHLSAGLVADLSKEVDTLVGYQLQTQTTAEELFKLLRTPPKHEEPIASLKNYTLPSLKEQETSINASKGAIGEIVELVSRLHNQHVLTFRANSSSLTRDTQRLKELINQTRQSVSRMSFSLSGQGQCFRSYQHISILDEANFSISLSLAKSEEMASSEQLLAFLQHPLYNAYYALELRNNSVRFSWRLTNQVEEIYHPWSLCAQGKTWFGIKAARVGSRSMVEVTNYASGLTESASVQSRSASEFSGLIRSSELYVGGLHDQPRSPPDLTRRMLNGSVDELVVNGKSVGLANFKSTDLSCWSSLPRQVEVDISTASTPMEAETSLSYVAATQYTLSAGTELVTPSRISDAGNETSQLTLLGPIEPDKLLDVTSSYPPVVEAATFETSIGKRHLTLMASNTSHSMPNTDTVVEDENSLYATLPQQDNNSDVLTTHFGSIVDSYTYELLSGEIQKYVEQETSVISALTQASILNFNLTDTRDQSSPYSDSVTLNVPEMTMAPVGKSSDVTSQVSRHTITAEPEMLLPISGSNIHFLESEGAVVDYTTGTADAVAQPAPIAGAVLVNQVHTSTSADDAVTGTSATQSDIVSADNSPRWSPTSTPSNLLGFSDQHAHSSHVEFTASVERTAITTTNRNTSFTDSTPDVVLQKKSEGESSELILASEEQSGEGRALGLSSISPDSLTRYIMVSTTREGAATDHDTEMADVELSTSVTHPQAREDEALATVSSMLTRVQPANASWPSSDITPVTADLILNSTTSTESTEGLDDSESKATASAIDPDDRWSPRNQTRPSLLHTNSSLPSLIKMRTSFEDPKGEPLKGSDSAFGGSGNSYFTPFDDSFEATRTHSSPRPVFYTAATSSLLRPSAKPSAHRKKSCQGNWSYHTEPSAATFGSSVWSSAEIYAPSTDIDIKSLEISLSYRTYDENGTLVYLSSHRNRAESYILVQALLGEVELVYVAQGRRLAQFSAGRKQRQDGRWHKMTLRSQPDGSRLLISLQDETGRRWNASVSNTFTIRNPISFGGLQRDTAAIFLEAPAPFRGCLANLTIKGRLYEPTRSTLLGPHKWTGVHPCLSRIEPGLFMDGKSFAIYRSSFTIKRQFTMTFHMKTANATGLLMSVSSGNSRAMALQVSSGRLLLTWSLGKNATEALAVPTESESAALCDKKWHSVSVSFSDAILALRVDGAAASARINTSNLRIRGSLYLGGFPDSDKEVGAAVSRNSFSGCLRDLHINDEPVSWYSLPAKSRVFLSGCPVST